MNIFGSNKVASKIKEEITRFSSFSIKGPSTNDVTSKGGRGGPPKGDLK